MSGTRRAGLALTYTGILALSMAVPELVHMHAAAAHTVQAQSTPASPAPAVAASVPPPAAASTAGPVVTVIDCPVGHVVSVPVTARVTELWHTYSINSTATQRICTASGRTSVLGQSIDLSATNAWGQALTVSHGALQVTTSSAGTSTTTPVSISVKSGSVTRHLNVGSIHVLVGPDGHVSVTFKPATNS
jgi:hypothetical protein